MNKKYLIISLIVATLFIATFYKILTKNIAETDAYYTTDILLKEDSSSDNKQTLYTIKYDGEKTIKIFRESKKIQTIDLVDGIQPEVFSLVAIDANVDGFNDLAFKTCEDMNGDECYKFYLFNYLDNKFVYSQEFSDIGFLPDVSKKEIIKHLKDGCAGDCFLEEHYKIVDGKPILIKKINQSLDYNSSKNEWNIVQTESDF